MSSSIGKSAAEGWEAYCDAIDGDRDYASPTDLEEAIAFAEAAGARECLTMLNAREGYDCEHAIDCWVAKLPSDAPREHLDAMRTAYAYGWECSWEANPIAAARCVRNNRSLIHGDC